MKTKLNLKAGYILNYSLRLGRRVKLSQGRYNEKLHVLKTSTHRLEFVSHMTSWVDSLVIFSKAKLEPPLTPKLKIHQF